MTSTVENSVLAFGVNGLYAIECEASTVHVNMHAKSLYALCGVFRISDQIWLHFMIGTCTHGSYWRLSSWLTDGYTKLCSIWSIGNLFVGWLRHVRNSTFLDTIESGAWRLNSK